jgi:hypothetical protein
MPESISIETKNDMNRVRITVGQQTLIGGLVLGDQTVSRALQELITHQVDITAIRPQLQQADAPITKIITDFWAEYSRGNGHQAK